MRPLARFFEPRAGKAVREPPIAFALALFSAALAVVFMRLLGTPILDLDAYRAGVGVAAACGLVTGAVVRVLRNHPSRRRLAWIVVPAAGGIVGIAVQALLLVRAPEYRTYVLASGLTTRDPVSWILVGAPLGAIPALVAAGVIAVAFRVVGRSAQDDRERIMLPFAGACAVVGAIALGSVDAAELPIAGGIVLLAALALLEILVSDAVRWRWLARVFAGSDPSFEVVPIASYPSAADVPAVVGSAPADAVIVRVATEARAGTPVYRGAAREAVATTAQVEPAAVAPLRRRSAILLAIFAVTPLSAIVAASLR